MLHFPSHFFMFLVVKLPNLPWYWFIDLLYSPHSVNRAHAGESEKILREAFAEASRHAKLGKPAVVFIDEIDSICPRRDSRYVTIKRYCNSCNLLQVNLILDLHVLIQGTVYWFSLIMNYIVFVNYLLTRKLSNNIGKRNSELLPFMSLSIQLD